MKNSIKRCTVTLLLCALLIFTALPCFAASDEAVQYNIELTDAERAYIAANPTLTIALDTSWAPYALESGGQIIGTIPNIFNEVCYRVGLMPQLVAAPSYVDAIAAVQRGEATVVSGIADDAAMAAKNNVNITVPYITVNYSAVTKSRTDNLYAQNSTSAVAVCSGSYATAAMREKMPTYTFFDYASNEQCMQAVLNGSTDMALIATYSSEYYSGFAKYQSLNSILINDFSWGLCFGISKTADPLLTSILNKSIATLTDSDINGAIYSSLIDAANVSKSPLDYIYSHPITSALVLAGIMAVLMLAAVLYVHNKRIKKQVEKDIEMNKRLVEATAAKQSFLSRMSHDMRTPLNAIIGFSDEELNDSEPEELRENLSKINTSGKYLLSLINDVLDMTKIESHKLQLARDIVAPYEIFDEVGDMLGEVAGAKGVIYKTDVSQLNKEKYIYADKKKCGQILVNLLSNAVKFTPEGGTVAVAAVPLSRTDKTVTLKITVSDTGKGMSREFMQHMYDAFEQESPSEGGTGLGLTITKSLVTLMGGTISCDSEQGRGTTFTIVLTFDYCNDIPDSAEVIKAKKLAAGNADTDISGLHVLVCEDHPLNVQVVTALLKKWGVTCDVAENGKAGVEAFETAPVNGYACVLMDIRMPVMDGYEATRRIRMLPRPDAKTTPIVAMTANAFREDVEAAYAAGMTAHIAKPFEPSALRAVLAGVKGEK